MKRRLKVQELEARIAPSAGVGLLGFLQGLAGHNADFGQVFGQLVDSSGNVDVNGAVDAANAMDTGNQFAPVVSEFTLSDAIVIPDSLARAIAEAAGTTT